MKLATQIDHSHLSTDIRDCVTHLCETLKDVMEYYGATIQNQILMCNIGLFMVNVTLQVTRDR